MTASEPFLTQQSLAMIIEHEHDLLVQLGASDYYARLAEHLSKLAHRSKPWTGRYIQSVASGTLQASTAFALAVDAYGATLDDIPALVAYTVPVTVYARPGAILPGAIVLGQSRPCAWPGCKTVFVPTVPWQIYCNAELHRQAARRNRRDTYDQ